VVVWSKWPPPKPVDIPVFPMSMNNLKKKRTIPQQIKKKEPICSKLSFTIHLHMQLFVQPYHQQSGHTQLDCSTNLQHNLNQSSCQSCPKPTGYGPCYCFTVPVVHLSYPSHVALCLLSHVICFHAPDLCSLLLFTCICFHLLPVVTFHLLFRQLCLLSSSPVFGSTRCCLLLNSLIPLFTFLLESATLA